MLVCGPFSAAAEFASDLPDGARARKATTAAHIPHGERVRSPEEALEGTVALADGSRESSQSRTDLLNLTTVDTGFGDHSRSTGGAA